jgi:hypothetical protein
LVGSSGTFTVDDTQKIQPDVYGHHGVVKSGGLKIGDKVDAQVDVDLRQKTMRNHSVTHLMHKALREVLGQHVQQKGSLVDEDKTRFDFSHDKPVTDEQIPRDRASGQRSDHGEFAHPCTGHADRGGEEGGRSDALRREVRRRGACARHRLVPGILRRYARCSNRRYRSVQGCIRKAASPQAYAASRRPRAPTRSR